MVPDYKQILHNDLWKLVLGLGSSEDSYPEFSWIQISDGSSEDFPPARRGFGITGEDKNIYLFGGGSPSSADSNDFFRFDTISGFWTDLTSIPHGPCPRYQMGIVCYQSMLYIYGGYSNTLTFLNDLYIFDTKAESWIYSSSNMKPAGTIPKGRIDPILTVASGKLYMFGGCEYHSGVLLKCIIQLYKRLNVSMLDGFTGCFNKLEEFDIKTNTWSNFSDSIQGTLPPKQGYGSSFQTIFMGLAQKTLFLFYKRGA
jgi:N-acetylneuraminic acid mutarotase